MDTAGAPLCGNPFARTAAVPLDVENGERDLGLAAKLHARGHGEVPAVDDELDQRHRTNPVSGQLRGTERDDTVPRRRIAQRLHESSDVGGEYRPPVVGHQIRLVLTSGRGRW